MFGTVTRDMSGVTVALLTVMLVWGAEAADRVCYPEVGCFSMLYPWVSRYRQANEPLPPKELPVRFDFYSRVNIDGVFDVDLSLAPWNPSRRTVIITHDHGDDGNVLWMRSLKDAYLEQVDANVIIMDWESGTIGFRYKQAAANIRVMGRVVAIELLKSVKKHGLVPEDFHLIGEGLGAHLMGYIAKNFHGTGRITGLDPSGKLFQFCDRRTRLDKSDANFVDIIHTSSRILLPNNGFGITQPIGHVDFYVNIGEYQPGCKPIRKNRMSDSSKIILLNWNQNTMSEECDHKKAREYFLQAVWRLNNCTFRGHKTNIDGIFPGVLNNPDGESLERVPTKICTPRTCTPMGLKTPERPARGVFFVKTRQTSPYCTPESVIPLRKPQDAFHVMVNTIASNIHRRTPRLWF